MRWLVQVSAAAALLAAAAHAQSECSSSALSDAYKGLGVDSQLVSCLTDTDFSAALSTTIDLASIQSGSVSEQVQGVCASSDCQTILSTLIDSSSFNTTNCTLSGGIVLMDQLSNLDAACDFIGSGSASDDGDSASDSASAYDDSSASDSASTDDDTSASGSDKIETTAPETTAPATTAPETTAPTTTAPDSTTTTPETTAPVATTTAPETTAPATTSAPATTTASPSTAAASSKYCNK